MLFYTCFDWFKKLRLFVNQCTEWKNRRHSQGVAVPLSSGDFLQMRHLWGYLNLFPIICFILKKIDIFFNIIGKQV